MLAGAPSPKQTSFLSEPQFPPVAKEVLTRRLGQAYVTSGPGLQLRVKGRCLGPQALPVLENLHSHVGGL